MSSFLMQTGCGFVVAQVINLQPSIQDAAHRFLLRQRYSGRRTGERTGTVEEDSTQSRAGQAKPKVAARAEWTWWTHLSTQSTVSTSPAGQIDRVPDKRKRAPGLPAVLRPKAEEDNPALTHGHFGERDFVLNSILAPQPSGLQHRLFPIAGDDLHLSAVGSLESRTIDEVGARVLCHGAGNWICSVDVNSQDRSGTIEIG